jgi:hypothetical protein
MDLVPGAAPSAFQNATFDLPQRSLTTNVNGAARNSNNTRLDGVNNMMAYYPHQTLYVAPQESVQTVSVSTNNFDAEQGMAGGSAITVQTKSGSNDLHVVGFEYLQNSGLSAKNYFTPAGSGVPKRIVNMYGGTIGGPIKKDKLFFFVGYEAMRDRQSYSRLATIPTPELIAGDFSATGVKLYDPNTGKPDGSGRTLFAGAQIPDNRIGPVARKMLSLLPKPNQTGFVSNYYAAAPFAFDRDNIDLKMDFVKSQKTTVWGKYSIMMAEVLANTSLGEAGGSSLSDGGSGKGNTRIQLLNLGATHTFSPRFLVDGAVGWSRYAFAGRPLDYGTNYGLEVLGIPGTNGPDVRQSGKPMFTISGYETLGTTDAWNPADRRDNGYTATANASWSQGRHDIRFGVDVNRNHINHWQPPSTAGGARGGFTFSGGVTSLKGGSSSNRFNALADFLLGLPQQESKSLVGLATIREWIFGLYFRDRWQITSNLTATLGLRWEYYPLPTRDHRGIERYDPQTNKVYIGGIAGVPDSAGSEASKKGFAPRVGLAYRIRNRHVIRSGYGITVDPFSIGRSMRSNYPTVVTGDWSGPNSYQPFAPIAQGIPLLSFPDISAGIIDMPTAFEASFIAPGTFRRGYIQSWNLIYETQLPWGFVGSAGYVATRSTRQRTSLELNSAPPGGGNAGRALFKKFGRTAATEEHTAWQTSVYDSLQASLDRRFANGLMIKTAYTWSKAIGYNDNSNDRPFFLYPDVWYRNRALQGFDRTHVFRTAWIYDLPFGPNRMLGHGAIARAFLSGWQVNGIFSSYSGTPFTVTSSGTSLNAPGNSQTADQVKGEVAKLGGIGNNNPWLDPMAFRAVTETRFGTSGRNSLRGPGFVNVDAGLFRRFRVTEKTQLEFRAEGFNITNTPHFSSPSANASNMSLNPDGSLKSSGSFMAILSAQQDQRSFRFGLRLSF